jgi:hypothetical protein
MALIPRLRTNGPLLPRQTTIFSALNGSLAVARPPAPPRPGPRPKPSGQSNTVLGRRLVGGIAERQVVELFVNARLAEDHGERGDKDISRGVYREEEEDDSDNEFIPRRRH